MLTLCVVGIFGLVGAGIAAVVRNVWTRQQFAMNRARHEAAHGAILAQIAVEAQAKKAIAMAVERAAEAERALQAMQAKAIAEAETRQRVEERAKAKAKAEAEKARQEAFIQARVAEELKKAQVQLEESKKVREPSTSSAAAYAVRLGEYACATCGYVTPKAGEKIGELGKPCPKCSNELRGFHRKVSGKSDTCPACRLRIGSLHSHVPECKYTVPEKHRDPNKPLTTEAKALNPNAPNYFGGAFYEELSGVRSARNSRRLGVTPAVDVPAIALPSEVAMKAYANLLDRINQKLDQI